jgi:hypothetical protein
VRGEEGFLVFFEVFFVGGEHTVEPGEEFVSAVVAVQDYGAVVFFCVERLDEIRILLEGI